MRRFKRAWTRFELVAMWDDNKQLTVIPTLWQVIGRVCGAASRVQGQFGELKGSTVRMSWRYQGPFVCHQIVCQQTSA